MNRAVADTLLLLAALIWGTAFVAQKDGSTHIGAFAFVGLRFLAAACVLAPLALREWRRARAPLGRGDLSAALLIGACLCVGCWLQQSGVARTSATNAGFLTAAYMVLVPFIAWAFNGRAPRPLVLVAAAISLFGAWLLGGAGPIAQWSLGDLVVLAADVVWALHICLIAHYRGLASRPLLLSWIQCTVTAGLSLPLALALQAPEAAALSAAWPAIAYAGIVSSGIAFTLQIVAQRHTPPAEAALIMALEGVFAALSAAILLHESLGPREAVGAALVLLGVGLVEAGPALLSLRTSRHRALSARRPV